MADTAPDSIAGYLDGVKWIVGLSGAVLAGVFLHPEQLDGRHPLMRPTVAVILGLFVVSMIGGVVYLLWLLRIKRVKENLNEINEELAAPFTIPDPVRRTWLEAEKKKLETEKDGSSKETEQWFNVLLWPFSIGALAIGVIFCLSVVWPKKPVVVDKPVAPVPLHFTVVQSAVHKTDHGMQAHTFLLNQQTGEMWQMVCDQKGAVVGFRRVRRLDPDGNPEPDHDAQPGTAKKP
ncbi:MAG: hypothetical protein JST61_08855 [Acidobacteria bacterium]|nr:hypothetical protein [Acidobacteriota bacterium]